MVTSLQHEYAGSKSETLRGGVWRSIGDARFRCCIYWRTLQGELDWEAKVLNILLWISLFLQTCSRGLQATRKTRGNLDTTQLRIRSMFFSIKAIFVLGPYFEISHIKPMEQQPTRFALILEPVRKPIHPKLGHNQRLREYLVCR